MTTPASDSEQADSRRQQQAAHITQQSGQSRASTISSKKHSRQQERGKQLTASNSKNNTDSENQQADAFPFPRTATPHSVTAMDCRQSCLLITPFISGTG